MKRRGHKPRDRWQPLQRAALLPATPDLIRVAMDYYNCDEAEARAYLSREVKNCEHYINDLYQVEVRRYADNFMHLNIRRRDGAAIHDWRHLQRIKNELIGPECEAVELYPAESRLVDTSNKYHLWGFADPAFRFPFELGTGKRDVLEKSAGTTPGLRQRRM